MKKLLLIFFLSSVSLYSQSAPKGDKVLNIEEKYEGEYLENVTDKNLSPAVINALNKRVPSKLKKYGFNDITIEEIGKVEYSSSSKFQVNLTDNQTGEYYKIRLNMSYNPTYIIKESEGGYCSQINEEKDKFTNKISYRSPISNPIGFTKIKKDDSIITMIRIRVDGSTINVGEKGVIILFDDGTTLNKPDIKINSSVNSDGRGYTYNAIFILNDKEIEKLSMNKITDVRLYIYDTEIKGGIKYQEYIKCIKEK